MRAIASSDAPEHAEQKNRPWERFCFCSARCPAKIRRRSTPERRFTPERLLDSVNSLLLQQTEYCGQLKDILADACDGTVSRLGANLWSLHWERKQGERQMQPKTTATPVTAAACSNAMFKCHYPLHSAAYHRPIEGSGINFSTYQVQGGIAFNLRGHTT